MTEKQKTAPATPQEAEELAKSAVQDYLNACRIESREQVADYLMKLVSVTGVVMAQANGSEDAVARLEGTAAFIARAMPKAPARMETVQ